MNTAWNGILSVLTAVSCLAAQAASMEHVALEVEDLLCVGREEVRVKAPFARDKRKLVVAQTAVDGVF